PAMQISIEASMARANFRTDGVDVGIRFGVGPWPDVHATRLAGDEYIAVVSPRYRKGRLPKRPEQLMDHVLFRDEPGQWKRWFAKAGIDFEPHVHAVDYNDAALFLQQAVAGEGIVLTRRSIAAADLAAGRLVQLFDIVLDTDKAYFLVCLPHAVNWPKIAAFRGWMISEIDWH
ncbi:MAG: XRE family transcriptional regulator, partial [Betaproteobacteria bacterium]|nr:XRE family transcriptional regulator [Betaproteobacteria bacterium]